MVWIKFQGSAMLLRSEFSWARNTHKISFINSCTTRFEEILTWSIVVICNNFFQQDSLTEDYGRQDRNKCRYPQLKLQKMSLIQGWPARIVKRGAVETRIIKCGLWFFRFLLNVRAVRDLFLKIKTADVNLSPLSSNPTSNMQQSSHIEEYCPIERPHIPLWLTSKHCLPIPVLAALTAWRSSTSPGYKFRQFRAL